MSFSLALQNGDLVQRGGRLGIVYGTEKLVQDLNVWLTEGYGGDQMHPEFGSILESYIGTIINPATKAEVRSEVLRVLQNYQAVQLRGIKNTPQKYSLSEILYSINDIKISITYDTVSVMISVGTAPPETLEAIVNISATNA
jgi:phage baseplate assembly protein W